VEKQGQPERFRCFAVVLAMPNVPADLKEMAGTTGLEPATSAVTEWHFTVTY